MAEEITQDMIDKAQRLLRAFHRLHEPHGYSPARASVEAVESRHGMKVSDASDLLDKARKIAGSKTAWKYGRQVTKLNQGITSGSGGEGALQKITRIASRGASKLHPAALPEDVVREGGRMVEKAVAHFRNRKIKARRAVIGK